MKFHIFNLLLLIVSICFFQSTHQYRLSKRELTEYDLTNFIVDTCSAKKLDTLIQNLCDQTLQSALMGNFPFLIYYCKTIGATMSYCNTLNQYSTFTQNLEAKRLATRRHVRTLDEENNLSQQRQKMDLKTDFELKLIMQICMTKTEKYALNAVDFCNQTLQERYSDIERFCKNYPGFDYCRFVRLPSSFYFWSLSSDHSFPSKLNPSTVSSSEHKTPDDNSTNDQQRINNNKQELS